MTMSNGGRKSRLRQQVAPVPGESSIQDAFVSVSEPCPVKRKQSSRVLATIHNARSRGVVSEVSFAPLSKSEARLSVVQVPNVDLTLTFFDLFLDQLPHSQNVRRAMECLRSLRKSHTSRKATVDELGHLAGEG